MNIYVIEFFRKYQGDRFMAVVVAQSFSDALELAKKDQLGECWGEHLVHEVVGIPTTPMVISRVSSFGF